MARVAVLDDDAGVAQSIAAYLCAVGHDADAFTTSEALSGQHQSNPFSAFILDWTLADGTAEPLIDHLQKTASKIPAIILLTGWEDGRRLGERLGVHVRQKPARGRDLASDIDRLLGR